MTDHSDLIAELRDELERLEAAAPLSARETARYLQVERHLLALSSQSLSLSEALERCAGWAVSFAKKCEEHQEALREIERLRGLLNANGKPRFNEVMRRLEAAEHEARVHSDAADGYRDELLSLRASLRKGAEVVGEAAAYDFVAAWHERQAKLFREMADDEPRTADAARKRAAEAATHHAASAAALRNRAADDRRAALVSGSREEQS